MYDIKKVKIVIQVIYVYIHKILDLVSFFPHLPIRILLVHRIRLPTTPYKDDANDFSTSISIVDMLMLMLSRQDVCLQRVNTRFNCTIHRRRQKGIALNI
jgi:hypothetical protein